MHCVATVWENHCIIGSKVAFKFLQYKKRVIWKRIENKQALVNDELQFARNVLYIIKHIRKSLRGLLILATYLSNRREIRTLLFQRCSGIAIFASRLIKGMQRENGIFMNENTCLIVSRKMKSQEFNGWVQRNIVHCRCQQHFFFGALYILNVYSTASIYANVSRWCYARCVRNCWKLSSTTKPI